MINKKSLKRKDLIYPELTYQIMGILFEVFKDLGPGYREKYYYRAIRHGLQEHGLEVKEQVSTPINFKGKSIGRNFLDFLVNDCIILEIKKGDYFSKKDIEQVTTYLKVTGLKLAIIINITSRGMKFKRIVNLY